MQVTTSGKMISVASQIDESEGNSFFPTRVSQNGLLPMADASDMSLPTNHAWNGRYMANMPRDGLAKQFNVGLLLTKVRAWYTRSFKSRPTVLHSKLSFLRICPSSSRLSSLRFTRRLIRPRYPHSRCCSRGDLARDCGALLSEQ